MKLQEIVFKKPVKVIQVFKKINIYGKEEKSFELRKEEMQWNNLSSKSGFVKNGEVFIPENILNKKDPQLSEIIILTDNASTRDSMSAVEENQYLLPALSWRFEIFELKKNLDIFLRYNEYEIGIPSREDFKLSTLKNGLPLEIKINGKTDFSMSAGKERKYKEQAYIFIYHGEFNKAKILKEPFLPVKKSISAERKVIDLIKPLW
jgi:hypothetical protein